MGQVRILPFQSVTLGTSSQFSLTLSAQVQKGETAPRSLGGSDQNLLRRGREQVPEKMSAKATHPY